MSTERTSDLTKHDRWHVSSKKVRHGHRGTKTDFPVAEREPGGETRPAHRLRQQHRKVAPILFPCASTLEPESSESLSMTNSRRGILRRPAVYSRRGPE